jgi:hypothetical protein
MGTKSTPRDRSKSVFTGGIEVLLIDLFNPKLDSLHTIRLLPLTDNPEKCDTTGINLF